MKKKSKNNLILGIILVGFIVGALYFSGVLNTILQLGGQWSHVNVTLSQEQIKIGEGADLNLKFNPVKQMIAECPGGGFNAFAVVSIYVDNSFYKIGI